jgi:hypothetical protein
MVVTEKRRAPAEKESPIFMPKMQPSFNPDISKENGEIWKPWSRITAITIIKRGPLPLSNSQGFILAFNAPERRRNKIMGRIIRLGKNTAIERRRSMSSFIPPLKRWIKEFPLR